MKKPRSAAKRSATEVDKYIGERLRAGRNAADLSQAELGDKLGVSFQQIQKYEKGTNRVSCGALVLMGAALNVPVGWFFEGCPGVKSVDRRDSTAMSVTEFFQEPGARALATDFVRLDPKHRAVVRQLAGSL